MINWWAEEWSFGSGASRISCGVSRTEEGYAVDVFRGETCVETFIYATRNEAIRIAQRLKHHYADAWAPSRAGADDWSQL